jgi:hypothetical protein
LDDVNGLRLIETKGGKFLREFAFIVEKCLILLATFTKFCRSKSRFILYRTALFQLISRQTSFANSEERWRVSKLQTDYASSQKIWQPFRQWALQYRNEN